MTPNFGPRPYERGDQHKFCGRGREARDLLSLILAERVVLFYAASGAGKTSLSNAQTIRQKAYRNATREEWERYLPSRSCHATGLNGPVPEE
jgi:hypothetical protein